MDADLPARGPLVGLAPADGKDKPLVAERHVLDIECNELAPAECASKPLRGAARGRGARAALAGASR